MSSLSVPRRIRSFRKLMTFTLFMVALLMSISIAHADPKDKGKPNSDPHTPVSSDGSEAAFNDAGVTATAEGAFVASAEGTGKTVKGGDGRTSDPEVAAVPQGGDEAAIESVIGADGRYRITSTTSYPYRAIAHITSSIGGCTGWLINANTVVTAGHCLHNGSWASSVRVYPGRNGTSTPYGSCGASRLYSVTGWTQNRDRNYDYGAIKLNCTVGNTTGWFGYRWTSSSLTGQATYIAGYPGDKTYATMWRHDDQVRITQTYRLYYANDTAGGQSGSPVWNGGASCSPCGIAIHAYGVDGTGYNGGTRITESVFNNLTTWKNS